MSINDTVLMESDRQFIRNIRFEAEKSVNENKKPSLSCTSILTAFSDSGEVRAMRIEISAMKGLPGLEILGFSSSGLREAVERIISAIKNSAFFFPKKRVLVSNTVRPGIKFASHFDLPVCLGILKATGQIDFEGSLALGGLSINGKVLPDENIKAFLLALLSDKGTVLLPSEFGEYAKELGMSCAFISELSELKNELAIHKASKNLEYDKYLHNEVLPKGLSELKGQREAVRAISIAACGFHNIFFMGAAGSGKSVLLSMLPYLFESLSEEEWKLSKSLCTLSKMKNQRKLQFSEGMRCPLITYRSGGGKNGLMGNPGSEKNIFDLSRNAVLIFEEITTYNNEILKLIQEFIDMSDPGERRIIAALGNPCPCGRYFEEDGSCKCGIGSIRKLNNKLSKAFRERFDISLILKSPDNDDRRQSVSDKKILNLKKLRDKVDAGRAFGRELFRCTALRSSGVKGRLDEDANFLAQSLGERQKLSLRMYQSLLRISGTVANLSLSEKIRPEHIAEASHLLSWKSPGVEGI